MDAFEQVVGEILWTEGNWVRTSVKVNLTKAEKAYIERGSSLPVLLMAQNYLLDSSSLTTSTRNDIC